GGEALLGFLGTVDMTAEEFGAEAGARGLAALTEVTRATCRRLLVAWEDRAGRGAAAAFALDAAGDPGPTLGVSWQPPESWSTPMVDAAMPPRQRIHTPIAAVRALITTVPRPGDFGERLQRAIDLLDTAIRTLGGEGQHLADARGTIEDTTVWDEWLDDLERSVRDEVRRVTGGNQERRIGVEPIGPGP